MYNMTRVCNFLYRPPILCNLLMQSKQLVYSAFWWIGSSNWRIRCQQILSNRLNKIQFKKLFLALPRQLCGRPCYWQTDKKHMIFLGHWKYDTWLHSKFVIKDYDLIQRSVGRYEREEESLNGNFWESLWELWIAPTSGSPALIDMIRMRSPCFFHPYDDMDDNFE